MHNTTINALLRQKLETVQSDLDNARATLKFLENDKNEMQDTATIEQEIQQYEQNILSLNAQMQSANTNTIHTIHTVFGDTMTQDQLQEDLKEYAIPHDTVQTITSWLNDGNAANDSVTSALKSAFRVIEQEKKNVTTLKETIDYPKVLEQNKLLQDMTNITSVKKLTEYLKNNIFHLNDDNHQDVTLTLYVNHDQIKMNIKHTELYTVELFTKMLETLQSQHSEHDLPLIQAASHLTNYYNGQCSADFLYTQLEDYDRAHEYHDDSTKDHYIEWT